VLSKKTFFLFIGLVLFALVIWQTGFKTILASFTEVGINYVWLILWPLFYYFFYAWGWFQIIPPEQKQKEKKATLWGIFKARLVGEAVSYLIPLGFVGAEPARTLYMRGKMDMHVTAATVVVDRTLYLFAAIVFILGGLVAALFLLDLSLQMKWACVGAFILLLLFLLLFIFAQHVKGMTRTSKFFMKMGWGKNWLEQKFEKIKQTDQIMVDLYRKRPWAFLRGLFGHLVGRGGGIIEIWLILLFLGTFSQQSIWQDQTGTLMGMTLGNQLAISLLIAVFVILLNLVFFMFPSQIGVAEGGTGLLFALLGYDPALGVALQIVRRVKSLFYIALGLMLITWRKKHSGSSN